MHSRKHNTACLGDLRRLRNSAGKFYGRFASSQSGNIVVMTAFVLPVLIAFGGATIDYAAMHKQVARLQAVADAAALAGTKGMTLSNVNDSEVKAIVATYVKHASRHYRNGEPIDLATKVDDQEYIVKVALAQKPTSYFNSIIYQNVDMVRVEATARVLGTTRICVLGLDESASNTVVLKNSARMTGHECSVYSNSTSGSGIHAMNSATLKASMVCSAGGFQGDETRYKPKPLTDCPKVDDPLEDRPEPEVASKCLPELTQVKITGSGIVTLDPGTYCGGIEVTDNATVRLRPGVYVIKDGPLRVRKSGTLQGENVGFFLTGSGARIQFAKQTTIELTAPESGEMAGLLFFEGRNQPARGDHQITSNNARILLGTIYLPVNGLKIDATDTVADQSAYTVIIAKSLSLFDGPYLVLNANYDQTDVPVPDGIATRGNHVGLVN